MKIAGIVAEYNPFHKGHEYQIKSIREGFGADTGVVCVMSGDFVQRGEPAIFSKYARAEAAVRCGADLVLELPVPFCIASAERFAHGAVSVLGELGVVDYLVFGSESGNTEELIKTADMLLTPQFDETVRAVLESGCSYPTARSEALRRLMNGTDATQVPNDNLGVEYIKAIKRLGYAMEPVSVQRVGAGHDCDWFGDMKSGSEIRRILLHGQSIAAYVPKNALAIYDRETQAGRGPVSLMNLEQAVLSRLRMCSVEELASLPDAAEGLENKIYKAYRSCTSMEEVYTAVKSKRYTHARIRRMTMCAALGISADDHKLEGVYARVLALNERGGKILRMVQENCTMPVISKPSVGRNLDKHQRNLFEKSADAHDLYVLSYGNREERRGESDWITSPIFVR